ncbi:mechanosensitive ion channel family protein [Opitutus terrae]|uniref:Mechanosensitive ion channel MscS domain-containing protein n=1 Tax=Opitutus terrae (strain DSM 11246 / JCM 15787 / PB90-1) TaxID=452637 RepID=B1ZZL3_OPITP|nr:mechanosensitive ion channel domain-containing protein [Opitutus terrae]ACB76416.1 hypothetical protein Oter_3136 [Opitutus terrae PB90-1]
MNIETPDLSHLWPALLAAVPSVLIIIAGAVLANILIGRTLLLIARRTSFTEQEIGPVRRVIKWVITVIALVLIFGAFGLNMGGVWGVLSTILAMVAIGFVAVWSVLSNTLCTLIIMIFRPFAVGDEVEFAGEPVKGRVIDLNFIYTSLDAGDGTVLQVPNNLFFQRVLRRRHARQAVSAAVHLRTKLPDAPEPRPATAR